MLVVLCCAITFIVTTIVSYSVFTQNAFAGEVETNTLSEKLSYYKRFIDSNYLYEYDENKMINEAIKGYFKGLGDNYTEYITKEEMEEYMKDATGTYVGIGIYLSVYKDSNEIVILAPMEGSPAEEAGIKSGDILFKIEGKEYNGDSLDEALEILKQAEGTSINLDIKRGEEIFNIDVVRREIKTSYAYNTIFEDKIGYIKLSNFDDGTYNKFLEKYNEIKEEIDSLIIDLRNNGGGIVNEATDIADLFNENGNILLITSSKNGNNEITKAKKEKVIDIPVVILVNEKSASASEILTAAIKENNDNVTIVGKKTYGKGVIQTIFTLRDGCGIKLTTNEYFTPKNNKINKVGITPDYDIDKSNDNGKQEDNQLNKAIEILK